MSGSDDPKPQGAGAQGAGEVGYGRPPQASRFKPGQSGNPAGRPKGARNLRTDLAEELGETIRIREGETEQTVSKQRALLKALMAKALKGDTRASNLILQMIHRHLSEEPDAEPDEKPLSPSDDAIVEDFLRRRAEAAARTPQTTPTPTPNLKD